MGAALKSSPEVPHWTSFEHEFLIRLAPIWAACRFRVMGGSLIGKWPRCDMAFDLLGMLDYEREMELVCSAEKKRLTTKSS
jgi:hypothetical protein